MDREQQPITLADVVRRAVDACDPPGDDARLSALAERFEDADEPITALDDLEQRLGDAAAEIDVEIDDAAFSVAVATVLYLAHRRDMLRADDHHLLRLAVRAEWHGDPPEAVGDWLAGRGVAA